MNKKIFLSVLFFLLGERMSASMNLEKATFAGGCFWCMEAPFEKLHGVIDVVSGYAGGQAENPTYQDYAQKGYIEAVQITYDPSKISYQKLLDTFWRQIDPTDAQGQFVDRGKQYRSAIFYHNDEQKKAALQSLKDLEKSGKFSKKIVTEILPAKTFYLAEGYHQDYYKNNPVRYNFYRWRSGRDEFLQKVWGNENKKYVKPTEAELRKKLTPLQYDVTQRDKTEKPFDNEYWDNKRPGIYVDIVSGEPLFSSLDKYDSGTGWPSFTKPISPDAVVEKKQWFGFGATEIRSKIADSHLGHVFKDGPPPTGLRYCMNSAALRFVPVQDLEKEGYGQFKKLFE